MICPECNKEIAYGSSYVKLGDKFYHGICGLIKKARDQRADVLKPKKIKP